MTKPKRRKATKRSKKSYSDAAKKGWSKRRKLYGKDGVRG